MILQKSQNHKKIDPHRYFQPYLNLRSCTEASHFDRMDDKYPTLYKPELGVGKLQPFPAYSIHDHMLCSFC